MTLTLPSGNHRAWTWRLNENLLDYTAVVAKVTEVITIYFIENAVDDLSAGMVWEGHKAVIRGGVDILRLQTQKNVSSRFC